MSESRSQKSDTHARGLDEEALLRVMSYVEENISQKVMLADIAKVAHLSLFHFSRVFKQKTGITMHQFVIRARLKKAKELLETKRYSIKLAAKDSGFCSQSHLNKYFRREYGKTAQDYLDEIVGGTDDAEVELSSSRSD